MSFPYCLDNSRSDQPRVGRIKRLYMGIPNRERKIRSAYCRSDKTSVYEFSVLIILERKRPG